MFSNVAVLEILEPYLTPGNEQTDAETDYINGGAQYALGLIQSNFQNAKTADVFLRILESEKEATLHGACLGIGLMAMGTQDTAIMNALKNLLFKDKAISGEAVAVAMGLVSVGQRDTELVEEMFNLAKDNKHSKITRELAIAISLNLVNCEN